MKNSYLEKIKNYKINITDNYDFIELNNLNDLNDGDYFCSKKYDGQTYFIVKEDKDIKIFNSNLIDQSTKLKKILSDASSILNKYDDIILVGELIYSDGKNRERNGDVVSAISGNLDINNLKLIVFDIVYSSKDFHLNSYKDKIKIFEEIFSNKIETIENIKNALLNKSEIQKFSEDLIQDGNEGSIIRNDQNIFKAKKKENLDLLVLGYTENENMTLRSITMGVVDESGHFLHVASSGNMDEKLAQKIYQDISKNKIRCDFHLSASDGSIYQFVKPTLIVEVEFFDYQILKSNDQPIKKMKFEFKNNSLKALHQSKSVSLIGCSIKRIRDDKTISLSETGLKQLKKIFSNAEDYFKNEIQYDLEKSSILQKKIFQKKSKKGTAIKKFVIWKTNKENNNYPAYVSYFLDYSSSRKKPMDKDTKPFSTEKNASNFINNLIKEEIKKGWEEVNG